MSATSGASGTSTFRLLVVPGVNPDRWLRVWEQRLPDVPFVLVHAAAADAHARLLAGDADAAVLRLPVDRDGLGVIALYTEETVALVARDHLFTAVDAVEAHDLADETVLVPDDDVLGWADAPGGRLTPGPVGSTADAVELVAAGTGVLVVPHSVARVHRRAGTTVRPITDAPGSQVALVWVRDREDDLVEELIGIVRGRTAHSSRGRGAPPEPEARAAKGRRPAAPRGTGGSSKGTTKGTSKGASARRPPRGRR